MRRRTVHPIRIAKRFDALALAPRTSSPPTRAPAPRTEAHQRRDRNDTTEYRIRESSTIPNGTKRLIESVQYQCPYCEDIASGPFRGVVQGEAGIWSCENCRKVFQIRIDFRPVAEEHVPLVGPYGKIGPRLLSLARILKDVEQRLLSMIGDLSLLRNQVQELLEESEDY